MRYRHFGQGETLPVSRDKGSGGAAGKLAAPVPRHGMDQRTNGSAGARSDMNMRSTVTETENSIPVLPQHDALALTAGGNLAEIVLGDQVYRLRITKAGKLILTK